jgi:hypothetical protein
MAAGKEALGQAAALNGQHSRVVAMRLKYLLGELLLWEWRPRLAIREPEQLAPENWPEPAERLFASLPSEADGLLCRSVRPERFPVGVSRYGEFLLYVPQRDRLYFVEIRGSFDDYLKKFSAKSRHNLTRSVRKFLEQSGANAFEVSTEPGSMRRFFDEAVAISRQTYQTRLLHSGLPETDEFYRGMVEAATQGQARAYLLGDQGRPIAFAWCRGRGSRLTYEVIGYLPESAPLSPGTVLLFLIVRDLFESGTHKLLDFGQGEAFYKSQFSTGYVDFCDAYLLRRNARNSVLVWLHYSLDRFSSWLGRVLEKAGLKKRVRMLLRRLTVGR